MSICVDGFPRNIQGILYHIDTYIPSTYLLQTSKVWTLWVWGYVKYGGTAGWKWCVGRGQLTIGSTRGYICKSKLVKRVMEQVPVESGFFLPKNELGHSPICLPHTSLKLCSTGYRHRRKVFYCCIHRQRVLAIRPPNNPVGKKDTKDLLKPF